MSTRLLDEMRDLMRRDQIQGTRGVRSREMAQCAGYAARVPASGMPVAAAVARVIERRSSGSMLCRRVLPAQRAIIKASPALALRMFTTAPVRSSSLRTGAKRTPVCVISPPEGERDRHPVADRVHPQTDELDAHREAVSGRLAHPFDLDEEIVAAEDVGVARRGAQVDAVGNAADAGELGGFVGEQEKRRSCPLLDPVPGTVDQPGAGPIGGIVPKRSGR